MYLIDVVVYSEFMEDHIHHLRKVFCRLREYQLYIKLEEFEFSQRSIKFLGHLISYGEIQMDRRMVEAILDWLVPGKVMELLLFLELASYYLKFIKGYSKMEIPLTNLLKKN